MGERLFDKQEAGGSTPPSRTKPRCKECGATVEPYMNKDGQYEEGVYWHTMYQRLRLNGCAWARTLLRFDPDDLENSHVEFK